jgi:predicted ABC-type ATPase
MAPPRVLILAGLFPFSPEKGALRAGRLMLQLIDEAVQARQSFAFETTLSGINYKKSILTWRSFGYRVALHFIALPNVEIAFSRVAERVRQGGHNIAPDVIRRRFQAGRKNFEQIYKEIVSDWFLYDGSGAFPVLLGRGGEP